MGYINHNAIIVTHWNLSEVEDIRNKALEIFKGRLVSDIVGSTSNGYLSFFIAPDGSKEGWEDSDKGDKRRDKFISYLGKLGMGEYVEVSYDECDVKRIVR